MKPINYLKREILLLVDEDDLIDNLEIYEEYLKLSDMSFMPSNKPAEFIEELWDKCVELDILDPYISDYRYSGIDTGLLERYSDRYYESKEVAKQITRSDKWIGWTYWYGGGKHGEPEAVDWMNDCYLLEIEVAMKPVMEFKVVGSKE